MVNKENIDFQVGMKVYHRKFGEGEIISIDSEDNINRTARIFFKDVIPTMRNILLKYAKLKVV